METHVLSTPKEVPISRKELERKTSVSHRCDVSSHTCTWEGNSRSVDVRRGADFHVKDKRKVSSRQVRRDVVRHAQGEGNSRTVDVRGDQNWIEMRGKKVRKTRCDVTESARMHRGGQLTGC